MRSMIYCKTIDKGVQEYYVLHIGVEYPLCRQTFKRSNKEFFGKGIFVDDIGKFRNVHSGSVRMMLDKLPLVIACAEKEYGLKIFNKSQTTIKSAYKRTKIRVEDYEAA